MSMAAASAAPPAWLPQVVADLRAVSADLLAPGLAKPVQAGATAGHGPLLRGLLAAVDAFTALLPQLLEEVHADADAADWRAARTPRGARPSPAPYDFALHGGRPLPLRWQRRDTGEQPDEAALRWALHLAARLGQALHTHAARLDSQLQDALLVRAGDSEHALQDAQTLRGLAAGVRRRAVALRQAEAQVRAAAGRRITPGERPPSPYPQRPAWSRLKRLARELLNPEALLGALLGPLLTAPVPLADLPFLYQRWCGLQLLRSFERQGWTRRGDLVGPLFLGGRVEFVRRDAADLVVWIDPRVSEATLPVTGWGVGRGKPELTPDFLVTCGTAGMRDAFVLDATLSRDEEVLASKARYRHGILGVDLQLVAGVPVQRRPLRAWAVAPLGGGGCRLGDPEGRTGCIPLRPGEGEADLRALDAWVGDVSLHARRQVIRADAARAAAA
ncbi:MAG: hypothetical protein QM788_05250 [Roseateles sp.]|uniref:hypothetical protein n=1 Tax=Roseateles sp. TaxID=1971397 RepID=UPI0039E7BB20